MLMRGPSLLQVIRLLDVPVRRGPPGWSPRRDRGAYAPLAAEGLPPLTSWFTTETRQPGNDLSARFFFEAHGVRADPATGNGAAFLGAWLLEHRYFPAAELSLRIEQGHEVQRPSLVRLRARTGDAGREVAGGGRVIAVVAGALR